MREGRAQLVLLVRAFEEVDRGGLVLPHHVRAQATRRALMVSGRLDWHGEVVGTGAHSVEEAVFRRARLLFESLTRRFPPLFRILRAARQGSGIAPALVVLALLLGLVTHVPAPQRQFNLLAFPLLGLLAWNLIVYAGLLLMPMARRRWHERSHEEAQEPEPEGPVTRLGDAFLKLALRRSLRSWRRVRRIPEDEARVTSEALVRFAAMWHRVTRPLLEARVRRMLHLGAIALTAGVVAGMYARAVALQYNAVWESTLLDRAQVQTLLDWILAPAAAVLGRRVPTVPPEPQVTDAAAWIHLWAMTAVLFVIVPRALLALYESRRVLRLARRLPVDLEAAYFRRIFTAWQGATRRVVVLPYSFRPKPTAVGVLRAVVFDAFGARADIAIREPVEYGGDAPPDLFALPAHAITLPTSTEHYCAVLFNLAQSPESEVHGVWLEQLKGIAEGVGGRLVVLLDSSALRQRVDAPGRIDERVRSWRRMLEGVGLDAVPTELDRPTGTYEIDDGLVESIRDGLWPAGEPAGAPG